MGQFLGRGSVPESRGSSQVEGQVGQFLGCGPPAAYYAQEDVSVGLQVSSVACPFQTQPLYLAQLIFLMPQSRSNSFMEMLVFSLFNYGSDRRDGFLLLQLFTAALRYEIR